MRSCQRVLWMAPSLVRTTFSFHFHYFPLKLCNVMMWQKMNRGSLTIIHWNAIVDRWNLMSLFPLITTTTSTPDETLRQSTFFIISILTWLKAWQLCVDWKKLANDTVERSCWTICWDHFDVNESKHDKTMQRSFNCKLSL